MPTTSLPDSLPASLPDSLSALAAPADRAPSAVSAARRPTSGAWARWLPGLVITVGLGCGPGCYTPQGTPAARDQASVSPEPATPPRAVVALPPPGPKPMLTDEARAARLHAQRVALGERAVLLEDGEGQPFPSLAPLAGAEALVQPAGFGAPVVAGSNLDALPGSQGTGPGGAAAPAVNGNLLGNFILLDGAGATGLTNFHEALRKLKRGEDEDGKVRVLVYGASHTAADIYPSYLRAYLQQRFGDGGTGYVPVVRPSKFYRPLGLTLEGTRGWKIEHAQKSESRDDGFYGLFGASAATSKKRDHARVTPAVNPAAEKADPGQKTRYELFYLLQPGGGKFKLSIDGKVVATLSTKTKGKEPAPGYHVVTLDGAPRTIEVQPLGDGEVRVFGVAIERDRPGVVVDNLGIGGTRASNQLKWDEHLWADNLARRDPDLIVLAYGTNESVDDDQPISVYRGQLREVLARLRRAAPEASCLLVGPGDFPLKAEDGTFAQRPRVAQIVQTQRELAGEAGCAFWDMMQFMGGERSMVTWAAAQPAMAQSDHLHLTRRGYARMGMALTDALMFDYDASAVPPPVSGASETQLASSAAPAPVPKDSPAPGPADPSAAAPAGAPASAP